MKPGVSKWLTSRERRGRVLDVLFEDDSRTSPGAKGVSVGTLRFGAEDPFYEYWVNTDAIEKMLGFFWGPSAVVEFRVMGAKALQMMSFVDRVKLYNLMEPESRIKR